MSTPGWYPDPSGRPGYRWWDGGRWTQQTTGRPTAAPGTPGGPTGGPPRRRGGIVLLTVVAGLAVLGLVAWLTLPRLVGERADSDPGPGPDSTISAWDETSRPSPTPTPPPASPTPSVGSPTPSAEGRVACPVGDPLLRQDHPDDGRVHGGSLSQQRIPGWEDYSAAGYLWAYDVTGQLDSVTPGWIASSVLGSVRIADGFETPEQSALDMMSCLASSDYYRSITGREDVVNQQVTVDGHPGWWVRAEIRVDEREVAGDVADVVVVDAGDGESLSFYSGCAPIGDTDRIALIDAARESLRVD